MPAQRRTRSGTLVALLHGMPALPQSEILPGPEKAVLFLLSLEEDVAAPIVNELSIGELRKLRGVASTIREVNPLALDEMFHDYLQQSAKSLAVPNGGMSYLKRLAIAALGPKKADEIFDPSVPNSPLRELERAHPDAVAALFEVESPQLVAAVIARHDPRPASQILAAMNPDAEADVLSRLASLSELPTEALEDVAKALTGELPSPDAETLLDVNGIARAAEVLNAAGRQRSVAILELMEANEPEIAEEVRLAMFTFEDLITVDRRDMRTLLREVSTDQLTIALTGAPDEVRSAIFRGLSERATRLILDDLEVLGRVRPTEVEAARKKLVQAAVRLEGEGPIDLGRD